MAFELPQLPFAADALAPHLSAETFEYHHGKHHKTYVDNLNKLVEGTPNAEKPLEEIIQSADGGLFNNAAQHWNHSFFWNCLTPRSAGKPTGALADAIARDFGSFEELQKEFSSKATTLFGSGWAWLVKGADGKLKVTQESNAGTPVRSGGTAILTCDVWEHAYYVDYRNARPKFVEAFWKVANWDFAAKRFGG